MRPAALVTGARRGIGRGIAVALAQAGFNVALVDLEPSEELDAATHAARAQGAQGCHCLALAADIQDIAHHDALIDEVENALGTIACLVNNAGVSVLKRGDLLEVTPEGYDHCLDINTRGTFFLTQAVAKRYATRLSPEKIHRSIITITSINAIAVSIARGEYCISKAGLSMASQLFAVRLAEHGVGVYEIQPGFIATEMTAPVRARYDTEIEGGRTAIRRWGTPQDIATVAVSMASGGLPYTVGQAVRVDGGLSITKF
jgi:NAD(P)-dependent dehydrogenase (short-subunit alcohol dehydrogenase family)